MTDNPAGSGHTCSFSSDPGGAGPPIVGDYQRMEGQASSADQDLLGGTNLQKVEVLKLGWPAES